MSLGSQNQPNQYKRDTVGIEKLQKAAEILLEEAMRCSLSQPPMGVPAMITAFAVVLTLGEILALEKQSNKPNEGQCIEEFCKESMTYDWLVDKNEPKKDRVKLLKDVRDGLAHALSLPDNVVLIPTEKEHSKYATYIIGIVPTLFIEAVRQRSREIFSKFPSSTVNQFKPTNVERSPLTVVSLGTVPTNLGEGLKKS